MKKALALITIIAACVVLDTACVTSSTGKLTTSMGIGSNVWYKQTLVTTNGVTNSSTFRFGLPVNIGAALQDLIGGEL
jgi:hypothetical protein